MWPFRKKTVRTLDDPVFGTLTETGRGRWEGIIPELWGYKHVHLLIDFDGAGPSQDQTSLYDRVRMNAERARERIESEVRKYIRGTRGLKVPPTNPIRLETVFIPKLPNTSDWRMWFALEGEDIYSFGAEVSPSNEISAFGED